jgi:hypothetical protein
MSSAADPVTPTERVLHVLDEHGCAPRRSGTGWAARCPAHPDRNPSLSVSESAVGNVLLYCHAGCTTTDVAAQLGLRMADLFPPQPPKMARIGPAGRVKATYNYCDEHGEVLYRIVRYEPKAFRQEHPIGDGQWASGRNGARKVLYQLPQVLAAKRDGRPIMVCEGEKDAENAQWHLDVVATTAPEGAGKWDQSYTEALAGAKKVFVVADRDEAGYRHARLVAKSLLGKVGQVVVVEPAEGKDLSDHVALAPGAKLGRLWDSEAPTVWLEAVGPVAEADQSFFLDWEAFWRRDASGEEWLAEPLIPAGRSIAIYAGAKQGKSDLVLDIVFALATGKSCLGQPAREPIDVMYLDYEMTQDDLYDHLVLRDYGPEDNLSHLHYASLPTLPPLDTPQGAQAVLELVDGCGARLLVIDTLSRVISNEENDAAGVQAMYRLLGVPLKGRRVTVIRLDHAGKDLAKGMRGTSAKTDDVDLVWQLTKLETGAQMKATHSRMSWIPPLVLLDRETSPVRYLPSKDSVYPTGTKEVAEAMDRLGLPLDVSRRAAMKAFREAGEGRNNNLVAAAIRWRKASQPLFCEGPEVVPGTAGTTPRDPSRYQSPVPPEEIASDQPGTTLGTTRYHPPGQVGPWGGISMSTTPGTAPTDPPDDEERNLL